MVGAHSTECGRGHSEEGGDMGWGCVSGRIVSPPVDSGPVIRLCAERVNGTLHVILTDVHGDGGVVTQSPQTSSCPHGFSQ